MLRPPLRFANGAALLGAALVASAVATSSIEAQALITPLGLTPGEWDFRLKDCVYFFTDCTGRMRVYASPADAPSMSPAIKPFNPFAEPVDTPAAATTVAGWDAFRISIPSTPSISGVRNGTAEVDLTTTASSFGTTGLPRSVYPEGKEPGFLSFPDVSYYRSDDYWSFKASFPPGVPLSARVAEVRFDHFGSVMPFAPLPIIRWETRVFTMYQLEYRTGTVNLKPSSATEFSPDIVQTSAESLSQLEQSIKSFLALPPLDFADQGALGWNSFNFVSRQTLLDVLRDIESGAAVYDDGFRMPIRDDLDEFYRPVQSVPEPGAMLLLPVGMLLLLARKRGERRGT